jgi:conjugative relaxase-like TrwC/TraI family protein
MRLGSLVAWRLDGVLSVAKLTLGQEAYYEQQVARGLDDYYAGRGESPGIWAGSGAEGLGLVGAVEDDHLGTLLRGVNPVSGATLRAPVRERMITVRTLDVESGEWREEQKRLAPVSGYDFVFSCPKSVSLLHALIEDEQVRREVSEAHETAWRAAVSYLEREACVVRRGKSGAIREHGGGFVAAAFRHRTSRAQDPHLHTHVIVANLTRTADDEWRALDGEALLKTYRLAAGYLYEAQLRHELTRRLGLAWTQPVKGMAELEQVPEAATGAFSTRRQSLVKHMEAFGTEGFAAARVAALATREAKEQVDLPRLREQWQARAAEHGLGRRELRRLVDLGRGRTREITAEQFAVELFGREGLTERQTTFTTPELVCTMAGSLRDGAAVEEVLEVAEELAQSPGVDLLEPSATPGRPARFTTRELLAFEHEALELALAGRDVDAPSANRRVLARTLMQSGPALDGEQRTLVHEAASRPDRIVCVVGAAGTGKTTALRALADACRESAVPVLGAAPSGRAADELAGSAGIRSSTLHRLLLDAQREGGLPRGCVLVVDEAGMAETRMLAPLLKLIDRAEGKAILVGDPCQLPAVGAGGLFRALCERLSAINLAGNRRQRDLDERRALAHLRAGEPEDYLALAARRGRLLVSDDPLQARSRLLSDWWQVAEHDLAGSVMIAYRRADVAELNTAARALMEAQGRLGPEGLFVGMYEFAAGDRVVCRRNADVLGVKNGTRGTVEGIDRTRGTLTLVTDGGDRRTLPAWYGSAGFVEHGYALTAHSAQGATVERAFVLGAGEGALREWGYVALSRARTETRLYVTDAELERETHRRPLVSENRLTGFRRALETSGAESLALEQASAQAAARLEAAERELASLGWRSRGRREELRREVALHRAALKLAHDTRERRAERALTPRPVMEGRRQREHVREARRSLTPRSLQPPGHGIEL